MQIKLRTLFSVTVLYMTLSACALAQAGEPAFWEHYKSTFISQDGRVIDYGQGQASTSEGQGYGMLLAVINGDKKVFDTVWDWTKANLSVRQDNLLAWLWGKRDNGMWEVMDYNNATDGDTLIAFALLKASTKWDRDSYEKEAMKVIRSIREKLAVRIEGKTFLLPGYYGFKDAGSITLNPSYMIFSAYRLFAEVDDNEFWRKIHQDGLELLKAACFGNPCLPADWIWVSRRGVEIAEARSTRFGHDAVRTLLHVSWAQGQLPEGLAIGLDSYKQNGYIPWWIDLKSGEISKQSAPAGFYAVYGRAAMQAGELKTSQRLFNEAEKKIQGEEKNYYSYSLYLLSLIKEQP
ncbi:hypothetical protein LCGC14_2852130 [marine sediment metagenome]|uniref:Glucanase n=1 Tax=marine sediment metagenome TaxID=412755 RepID=A0A0F8Y893_9ZZZZ